jgi:hypothetical protein
MSDQTLSERIDALADVLGNAGYGSDALRLEAAAREVATLEEQLAAHIDFVKQYQKEVADLKTELDGLHSWKRGVDAALNTGDGAYRP